MSSLADLPDLVGFFSYARRDDDAQDGALARQRISNELEVQLGRKLRVRQDAEAIPLGTQRNGCIQRAIAESAFFILIIRSAHASRPLPCLPNS